MYVIVALHKAGSLEGKIPLITHIQKFPHTRHQLANQRNFWAIGKSLKNPEHHTFVAEQTLAHSSEGFLVLCNRFS